MSTRKPSRPLIRYHGGKWRLAPWIIAQMPKHRVYVEPFGGAASVLLQKRSSAVEVLNDKHLRLVNVFRVLRDETLANRLREMLRFTPCSEWEYQQARQQSEDPVEDARRMIILGHQSHGSTGSSGGKLSGWRRGDRGRANAGSSSREWGGVWQHVETWAARVRSVYIECSEASDVMLRWDALDALHYIDPPYVFSTRSRDGRGAYAHEMTDSDHEVLAGVIKSLIGAAMISGYASSLYEDLYAGWTRIERPHIADKSAPRTEVLWMNFEPEAPELFAPNKH